MNQQVAILIGGVVVCFLVIISIFCLPIPGNQSRKGGWINPTIHCIMAEFIIVAIKFPYRTEENTVLVTSHDTNLQMSTLIR